ncbi:hypothetical protein [Thermomonospora cellulosilytica]|uniref:HEAT repeat protein n=1 Tax=Thermomonospora cellulosilytica TaxID=1411118 RepID=A0A7W3MYH2_9ACTN|nr:hypothetical protein [Thermomonospora cellulosilytica]MBA9004193.1 hypothetical protein [Thermomonospora cellulosilytica]
MRELALHARRLAGDGRLRDVLAELSSQGPHERMVALHMAMAGRDLDHVARVLAGPDMRLRRAALRAVRTLPVPDRAAAAVLEDAPAELRRAFYRTLLHSRRTELADRLLPEVRDRWGDPDAAALLPACSAGVVSAVLPELAHAVVSWRAIGKRHPGALLDVVEAQHVWQWRRYLPGLELAARSLPDRTLSLLERSDLGHHLVPLSAPALRALVRADPVRTARILRGSWRRWASTDAYRKTLRWWPVPEVLAAVPRIPEALPRLLGALPPGLREAAFDAVVEHDDGSRSGVRALPVLPLLPPERAAAEARRMLEWHASVWHPSRSWLDDPGLPLKLTSHLPYEEAAGPLTEAAKGGDPRLRGLARRLLVECAARTGDSAVLRRLLSELVPRTVTDRDPLRGALLEALAKVRPALFDDGFVHDLGRLSAAAVDAPDSSAATRHAVRALADRVLRHIDPGTAPRLTSWALDMYAHLVMRHGAGALGLSPADDPPVRRRRRKGDRRRVSRGCHRLDLVLRPGQERELYDRLRPCLRSARERQDFAVAVVLARSLRRRAFGIEELQDDLRSAALHAPEPLAREAAGLWLADGARREERAVDLLGADPSMIALPQVWRVVAGRRTDLLTTAAEGDAGWVSEPPAGFAGRWTPAQRDRVRALLGRVIADETTALQRRVNAMAWLGRLTGSADELAAWAEHDDTVIAEAALGALAHGDEPERALSVLLAHGRGHASRTVVAAMARCCAAIPPSRLAPVLEAALTGPNSKVTVRKQAALQLVRNRPPGAVDILLDAWNDPGLHRDVRVSVATALRRIPEDARALRALDAAVEVYAGGPLFRALCQAQPWEYAPSHRPAYAALVLRLLDAATDPGVRFRAAKAFRVWAEWYEGGYDTVLEAVADPADPDGDERLPVFMALLSSGQVDDQVLPVLERLLTAGSRPRARDRIVTIARGLTEPRQTSGSRDLARRAADLLAGHPRYLAQATSIMVQLLPEPDDDPRFPDRLADELWRLADALRDRPVLATRTFGRPLTSRISSYGRQVIPPDALLPAARRLAAEGHLVAELLALAITDSAGLASGWTAPWREVLDGLRRSPRVEIHSEAWHITLPDP